MGRRVFPELTMTIGHFHAAKLAIDRQGSVSMLFAVLLVVIVGSVGLALDFSRMDAMKSKLQVVLDSAVLAGASAQTDKVRIAEQSLAANFSASGLSNFSASFSSNANSEVSGTVTADLATSFASILGFKKLELRVRSAATNAPAKKVCALVLDPSASQALLINGGASVSAPDCEIQVKSTANPAAVFNAGTTLDTAGLCIEGASIIDNGGTHPNLLTNCRTASDPYAGRYPEPNSTICDYNNGNYNGGSVNLNPGVYCGWHNFNAAPNVNFAPGVYIIKSGGWNVNGGTWTGNGVVFYFADTSTIQFNSGVHATLTPPVSGDYEGVAFLEKEGLARSPLVLNDALDFDVSGIFYLPSRDTTFNSGSGLTNKNFTLVVNTLILNQTNWTLDSPGHALARASGSVASHLTR